MELKLDELTGDLAIENNALVLIEGNLEVSQLLRERLRTFLGEWFLDLTIGVPYFQEILKKQINPTIVSSLLKDEILSTPGVLELQSFALDLEPSTRILTLDFAVRSEEGTIELTEVIP